MTTAGRAVVTLEMLAAVTIIPSELAAVARVMGSEAARNGLQAKSARQGRLGLPSESELGGEGEEGGGTQAGDAGGGAAAPARGAVAAESNRMPHVICSKCSIASHEAGARFCRGCGAGLVLVHVADMRVLRDEARHAKEALRGSRARQPTRPFHPGGPRVAVGSSMGLEASPPPGSDLAAGPEVPQTNGDAAQPAGTGATQQRAAKKAGMIIGRPST